MAKLLSKNFRLDLLMSQQLYFIVASLSQKSRQANPTRTSLTEDGDGLVWTEGQQELTQADGRHKSIHAYVDIGRLGQKLGRADPTGRYKRANSRLKVETSQPRPKDKTSKLRQKIETGHPTPKLKVEMGQLRMKKVDMGRRLTMLDSSLRLKVDTSLARTKVYTGQLESRVDIGWPRSKVDTDNLDRWLKVDMGRHGLKAYTGWTRLTIEISQVGPPKGDTNRLEPKVETSDVKTGHPTRPIAGWSLNEPTQPDSFISELEKFEPGPTHYGLVGDSREGSTGIKGLDRSTWVECSNKLTYAKHPRVKVDMDQLGSKNINMSCPKPKINTFFPRTMVHTGQHWPKVDTTGLGRHRAWAEGQDDKRLTWTGSNHRSKRVGPVRTLTQAGDSCRKLRWANWVERRHKQARTKGKHILAWADD
ncbi:hypothetical protein V8G54_024866 [Vigna mungo]|uniref:Uncharacterized protein n=1 Tax=Vigna mungo TaxID=3915 RepID=A0AAQ3N7X2_VIGMU